MVFAAYNAGPSRVMEWVQRYGDPRKPEVDPVDWVERIPFAETRNYVRRVVGAMGGRRTLPFDPGVTAPSERMAMIRPLLAAR